MKYSGLKTRSYVVGFVLSLALTLAAYILVVDNKFSARSLMLMVAGLAVTQFIVQLVFFLHLGRESKPRFNLLMLIFALGVVLILVFGSLWIMINLDYHHEQTQSPAELDKSIIQDEGIKP
jgi:cytochrome o ubiquinol oxidase operon protein cyoD